MPYTLRWSDTSLKSISIPVSNGATDTVSTSITLSGKGRPGWGEPLQESMLHMLENFASNGTAPIAVTLGQLWYDANKKRLKLYGYNQYDPSSAYQELAYRRIDSAVPPILTTYNGDTWYDTTNKFLNVFSTSWSRLAYDTQTWGNYSPEIVGSAVNAYVVALNPVITVYTHNFTGQFKVTNPNTGASTINCGGGPVNLVNDQGAALISGDLQLNRIISYVYIFATNTAYITSAITSQTGGVYAALNGNSGNHFQVANPVTSVDAVSKGYADIRYAALNGNSGNHFQVSNPVTSADTMPQSYADTRYAPIAAASSLMPVGTVIDFAGPAAPAGYLACPNASNAPASGAYAAQIQLTSAYPLLSAALQGLYGGNATTTFGIPWFPDSYSSVSSSPISPVGSVTTGDVKSHVHPIQNANALSNASSHINQGGYSDRDIITDNTLATGGAANFAAGIRMLKCIKHD